MNIFENISQEFNELSNYFDEIMPPTEKPMMGKLKDALIDAYSHGYHDGQQAMFDRLPKPTDTGGDAGWLEYYESL